MEVLHTDRGTFYVDGESAYTKISETNDGKKIQLRCAEQKRR